MGDRTGMKRGAKTTDDSDIIPQQEAVVKPTILQELILRRYHPQPALNCYS